MVDDLEADSCDGQVLISQRVENKVEELDVVFVEGDSHFRGVELEQEFVDTLSNNFLNVKGSLQDYALLEYH